MRIAIISDIHSNLEAVTKALQVIDTLHIDEVLCLGDVVGYGANPNECIEVVRERCPIVLKGNHDAAAVDLGVADSFTSHARRAIHWTARQLTAEHSSFLSSLPLTTEREGALLVHGSPFQPEEWHYILSIFDAAQNFKQFSQRICFVGHSHVPGIFSESTTKKIVDRSDRFIVNVGSVGQPRDGDPRLSFGVFDTAAWTFDLERHEYDVERAGAKIVAAGLPEALAERLEAGM